MSWFTASRWKWPAAHMVLLSCMLGVVTHKVVAQPQFTSADVPAKGKSFVQMDYMHALDAISTPGWTLYTLHNAVGVGHGLELSAAFNYMQGDDLQPLAVTPGAKWQALNQERAGISLAIGGTAFVSMARASLHSLVPWGLMFGVIDHSFGERGPTAAVGAYTLIGTRSIGESRAGLVSSISQTITPSLELSTEWISGDNYFGSLSPGATISRGNISLWLGYVRGTRPRGNSGPSLSFAIER